MCKSGKWLFSGLIMHRTCHCEERSDVAISRYDLTKPSTEKDAQTCSYAPKMVVFPAFYREIATSPTAPRNDTVVVFFCVFIWRASALNNHLALFYHNFFLLSSGKISVISDFFRFGVGKRAEMWYDIV